ncbi:hypothetical protein IMZ48_41380, partial [Candidatus Bathyarchaeota archaeon]|nr:hypothetical protein [Candidatus Bathyarchaeota archaeon]
MSLTMPDMTEGTNRDEVRAAIAAGGWSLSWGDLIDQGDDVVELTVFIPTNTIGAWVSQQVDAQIQRRWNQRSRGASDAVVNQATAYLKGLLQNKISGERDFNGLGVKAGIVMYYGITLPYAHQPYIGVRVTKPFRRPSRASVTTVPTNGPTAPRPLGWTPDSSAALPLQLSDTELGPPPAYSETDETHTRDERQASSTLAGTAPTSAIYVRALYDYETDDRATLSFHEGDVI